ncbi:hypothetical protein LCGC14_0664140 [marine sediment metagenome]|uniref:Uncharacterized protein n=1 Tax=marine sediment metagenome TaxID=412755 RepID=A0A0F9QXV0_9ZZZZ
MNRRSLLKRCLLAPMAVLFGNPDRCPVIWEPKRAGVKRRSGTTYVASPVKPKCGYCNKEFDNIDSTGAKRLHCSRKCLNAAYPLMVMDQPHISHLRGVSL